MKRPAPAVQQPPPADSSDDEEYASTESMASEDGEESSDSEQLNEAHRNAPPPKLSSAPPPRANPPPQRSVSSSGSESESDSDSDVPIGTKAPQTQPKGRANPTSTDPSESDDLPPTAGKPPVSPSKLNKKRPRPQGETTSAAEDVTKTPSKKSNVAGTQSSQKTGEQSSKKPLFQRLWSDEDEVTLLGGMVDFWDERGIDPSTNINAFYEFIKERLHLNVVQGQLATKIRNCRKKFYNNEKRSKNGKDRAFAKATEQQAFDLSKKLWSSEGEALREKAKANGTASKKKKPVEKLSPALPDSLYKDESRHKDDIRLSLCHSELSHFLKGRVDDGFVRLGVDLISDSKRKDLEERWKKLNLAELQILSERALLVHEQTNMIIEAIKQSGGQ